MTTLQMLKDELEKQPQDPMTILGLFKEIELTYQRAKYQMDLCSWSGQQTDAGQRIVDWATESMATRDRAKALILKHAQGRRVALAIHAPVGTWRMK